ncbi:MAG: SixA phosphatase family protein [Thermoplasmatota archaeon]
MTVRELLLLRHADAADPSTTGDAERPLTAGGVAKATRLGRLLGEAGWIPDVVVTSPARRARETAMAVCQALPILRAPVAEGCLYEADVAAVAAVVSRHKADRLMVVGHNPSLSQAVTEWTGSPESLEKGACARLVAAGGGWRLDSVVEP